MEANMPEAYTPDIVIYHANCMDGFAAAWACWKRWGDSPTYIASQYGNTPPDVTGKHVLIVDFSFKRSLLEAMGTIAKSIIILDHHKTAAEDLAPWTRMSDKPHRFTASVAASMNADLARNGYAAISALFDMDRSGAMIAWQFCHGLQPAPPLIELVQDRDLWRFVLPQTRAFHLLLTTIPRTFEAWDRLATEPMQDIEARAALLLEHQDQLVAKIASRQRPATLDGHGIMVAACPYELASEVGHHILASNPFLPFAVTYCDDTTHRTYSLRSDDQREDVSEIAKKHGGGGHRNAAGFKVPLP